MFQSFGRIWSLLDRPKRRGFLVLLALNIVVGMVELLGTASIFPFIAILTDPAVLDTDPIIAPIYAALPFDSHLQFLMAVGLAIFVFIFFGKLLQTYISYASYRFARDTQFALSRTLLTAYLGRTYAWFLNRNSADLATTILSETEQVVVSAVAPALRLIGNGVVVIAIIFLLVLVDPIAAFLAAAVVGGTYALIFFASRRFLSRIGTARLQANQDRYQIVQEAFGGIKEVKLRGIEPSVVDRFTPPGQLYSRNIAISEAMALSPRYFLEAIAFGAMLLVLLVLLVQNDGAVGAVLPTLGLYAFGGARMFPALQQVYGAVSQLRFAGPALARLHLEVMDARAASDVDTPTAARVPTIPFNRRIVFDDITFTYPGADTPSLDRVSLEIAANTTVGFVGSTGAGKTTAVDVLLGLLQPAEGKILIDGQPLNNANVRAWQDRLGYVPQHLFLADDTLAANIAFGVSPGSIDMDAVRHAARLANADDFITRELPQGYDTVVGERGVRLSGGQVQRIGIARALYADPDVLVFDEATSALDNLTEKAVMEAVTKLSRHKTIVIIAHRLSTVRACDQIFYFDAGRLRAKGSYDELTAGDEAFKRMARAGS